MQSQRPHDVSHPPRRRPVLQHRSVIQCRDRNPSSPKIRMRVDLVLVILALLVAVAPASAEPAAPIRATESFQQARAAFARREFTAAAAAFEQAAAYEPHPVAWLDAAEAWEK